IDREVAAVLDLYPVLRLVGVQDRGDVVLGMTRGEEHAGHRQNPVHAPGLQAVEPVADDRLREFEKAVIRRILRQALADARGPRLEFLDRLRIAAAMAADHHADLRHLILACLDATHLTQGPDWAGSRPFLERHYDSLLARMVRALVPADCPRHRR